jgi:hypothetical protein
MSQKLRRSRPVVARLVLGATAFIAIAGAEGSRTASAATINVGSGCTLLQAVSAANGDVVVGSCTKGSGHDDIVLAAGTFTLSSAIEIWSDLTIRGAGMGKTIVVSSNVNAPSFNVGMGQCEEFHGAAVYVNAIGTLTSLPVAFQDLTLQPAAGVTNNGVCVGAGSLSLNGVRVTGFQANGVWIRSDWAMASSLHTDHSLIDLNHAFNHGGGIYFRQDSIGGPTTAGSLAMNSTTVSNNSAEGMGGGLYIGEPLNLDVNAVHIIRTSTFSGNSSLAEGGAICDDIQNTATYLEIFQTTISANFSNSVGGGISKVQVGDSDLELFQDIIHGNTGAFDSATNNLTYNSGEPSSQFRLYCSNSLIQLTGAAWTASALPVITTGPCDFTTTNAKLGALVGKGGTNNLPVHPLLAGSPAIDTGFFDDQSPADERGYSVMVDGDANGTKTPDRGSYEYIPFQFETESLAVAAKSSVTHSVLSGSANASYSNSGGTNLVSTATGQFVTYQTPTVSSGTYAVRLRFKKGTNAGQFQVSWSSTVGGTYAAIGSTVDGYASSSTWTEVDLGNITLTGSSARFFKLAVTGKNASSSGFQLFPDFIMLRK